MTTHRTSGSEAHAAKSARTQKKEPDFKLYMQILQGLPWGIIVLYLENPKDAKTFRIVDVNPAAAAITRAKFEDLRGKTLAEFPKLFDTPLIGRCLYAIQAGGTKDLGEITYEDEHIRKGTYAVQVFPLSRCFMAVAFENVTDQRIAEQALKERGELSHLLIQSVREYAILELDAVGHVVSWNAGAERLLRYSAEEIIGKHFSVFYSPEDVASGRLDQRLAQAAQEGQNKEEGWRFRKDGSRFWASGLITALRDTTGGLLGFAKLIWDLTERREKEEALVKAKEQLELRVQQRAAVLARVNQELRAEIGERQRAEAQLKSLLAQLRSLAAHLQSVREEERTFIAREIHDELGQACTAIKMDLKLIGRKTTKRQEQLRSKIDATVRLVDDMIGTLRRIASELRPRTLDDLGLIAAIEWQAQEFERRTGIPCQVTLPSEALVLDAERSTAIFRIFQECLTNVARHARATRVEVRLTKEAEQLIFRVHDDGQGFDPEEAKARKSLGLLGMRERALLLSGELRIEGNPGAGTTVALHIPVAVPTLLSRDSR